MPRYLTLLLILFLSACGTTDSTLREQGHNDAYVIGFHDGRHSGMREAGNHFEHFVQDRDRYDTNDEYREGWLKGEEEGKRMPWAMPLLLALQSMQPRLPQGTLEWARKPWRMSTPQGWKIWVNKRTGITL